MKSTNLRLAIRHALAAGAVATAFGGVTAVAQQADADPQETRVASLEEIVVTGSRIRRTGFDTMVPATVIDADFIGKAGYTNIADALNEIPSFAPPDASTEGDQSAFSVGQSFVNYFGLGSQRTLTLVNGRRFVSSNAPTIFSDGDPGLQVDLNTIPAGLIERVETIAVGGAPIYGADAIAGTVNIILRTDYEGFEIGGSWSDAVGEWDAEERRANLLYGTNISDGRGNLVVSFEYNDRAGLLENERSHLNAGYQFREPAGESEFTRVLVSNATANIVSRGGVVTPGSLLIPNFGLGAIGTNTDGSPRFLQFGPDGSLVPYNVGTPTGNAVWSVGGEGIFLPDLTSLFTPIDRVLVNSFMTHELTSGMEFFGEIYYANTKATELVNQPAYQSGLFGEESFALNFSIDHPLLNPAARQTLVDAGLDNFWIQRASTDLGDRRGDQQLNLWRFVTGLRGDVDVVNRNVTWDVAYIRGRSVSDTRTTELINDRFFYALDVVDTADGPACRVVADPSSRPTDPSGSFGTNLGQGVFSDCVPLDIFGSGRASQAAIDYVSADATTKTTITQEVWSLNAQTEVFSMPAGDFSVGLGYEFRREGADFATDGITSLGLGRSVAIGSTAGAYRTDEFYGEFFAPIVSPDMDVPVVFSASVEGAYRSVRNSFAGRDDAWTIGGRFAPVQDVELRGNVTRSVRAPAITELFLPLSGNFVFASDPCDQRFVGDGPNPATRRANCIADGIDPDTFTSNVVNASVQGRTGGNVNLENETADAWTVGMVLRPRWVDGLTMAIDYIDIDLEDAIESFTLTQIMQSCYDQDSFPNTFCDQFIRLPNGQLPAVDAFTSGFVNAGERRLRTITVDLDYQTELSDWGFISSRVNNPGILGAKLLLNLPREDITRVQESEDDRYNQPNQPKISGQLNLSYSRNSWDVLWQTRYISSSVIDNDDAPNARDIMSLGRAFLFSAAVGYNYNENIRFQLNMNNVFDRKPEPAAIASGWDNVYGNLGRYLRFGFNVKL